MRAKHPVPLAVQQRPSLLPARCRLRQVDAELWIDTAIILGVVIINALLGFIQERRAEKALVIVEIDNGRSQKKGLMVRNLAYARPLTPGTAGTCKANLATQASDSVHCDGRNIMKNFGLSDLSVGAALVCALMPLSFHWSPIAPSTARHFLCESRRSCC